MKAKLIIITVLALCSFTVSAQEFIAPYNMLWGSNGSSNVIDTVPADEIWKIEAIGSIDMSDINNYIEINGKQIRVFQPSTPGLKFPFWLDSGDFITLNYSSNKVRFISILRFKKPD